MLYKGMRGLNPRQIEAFRAVVLTGGVGMAAKLINVEAREGWRTKDLV